MEKSKKRKKNRPPMEGSTCANRIKEVAHAHEFNMEPDVEAEQISIFRKP